MYDSDENDDLPLSPDGVTWGCSEPVEKQLVETDVNSDKPISPIIDGSATFPVSLDGVTWGCSEPVEKQLIETDVNSDKPISLEIDGSAALPLTPDGIIGRCSEPFEKQLTETDVNVKQCRLSIHKEHVEAAVSPLLKEGEDINKGIPVKVYDGEWKEYSMTLKLWSNKIHVLMGSWKDFCTDHGFLAHQDFVTLLVFRHRQTDNLCFQITSRRTDVFEPVNKKRKP